MTKPSPNSREDRDEKRDNDKAPPDSLDRLAEFTKRIVTVPKSEIDEREKASRKRKYPKR